MFLTIYQSSPNKSLENDALEQRAIEKRATHLKDIINLQSQDTILEDCQDTYLMK